VAKAGIQSKIGQFELFTSSAGKEFQLILPQRTRSAQRKFSVDVILVLISGSKIHLKTPV
jgi:hypothetical protein